MAVKKQQSNIYQLKITLKGSKPPIWRRIQVNSDITLHKLHKIIQIVMGWYGGHLHQFIIRGKYYGIPDPEIDFYDVKDERRVKLNRLVSKEGEKFIYEYDFGDDWEHVILLEKILPPEPEKHYPICIKGKRACPPEDCGGIWGYEEFLKAIKDPNHPEHEEMLEWIGGDFDPEEFDLEYVNEILKEL